eukprot:TRINITY_DN14452_c0_g1_i1.p1 TRINITY_DN14452_c0_g1~~TRINITY_DN14452_c0_g1_i1.p1  ORF type:complete len:180 (+),score=37.23 TRINITY_DN14452_c0_g1_i1:120-659(+)
MALVRMITRPLLVARKSLSTVMVARRAYAAEAEEEEEVYLKDTKTHANLVEAFKGESMANRRYLYFAQKADVAGQPDVASIFRSTAEGETGHAHGHLEFLEECGDPATDEPFTTVEESLQSAIAGETHEYTDMYPGMSKTAREEGFDDVADWFDTLAMAEKSHAGRFQKALAAYQKENA